MGVRWVWRLLLMVFSLAALAPAAGAVEPERAGQEGFLKRAAFADGRLWVLSDAGGLSSITPGAEHRTPESLPGKIVDLCVHDGVLTLITDGDKRGPGWVLYLRTREGAWGWVSKTPKEDEAVLGMTCNDLGGELVTSRRVILYRADEVGLMGGLPMPLSGRVGRGLVASVHSTPGAIWIGVDAGEWGGGLYRLDLASGTVAPVESMGDEPVNAIENEPWKPGCLVAALGSVLNKGLADRLVF